MAYADPAGMIAGGNKNKGAGQGGRTMPANNTNTGTPATVPVAAPSPFGAVGAYGEQGTMAGNPMNTSDNASWVLGRSPYYAKDQADAFAQTGRAYAGGMNSIANAALAQGQASGQLMGSMGMGGMNDMANIGAKAAAVGAQGQQGLSNMGSLAFTAGQQANNALGGYGQSLDQRAMMAGQRATPMTNYGAANATQGNVMGNANALAGLEAQQGPSGAQAQLQAGLNQAQSSNLALARSGRGWGGNAAAMAQAQGLNAAAGQQASNQAMMLRAQEDAAWRQRQAANLGMAGQLGSGIAGQQVGQAQFLTNADLQSRQINDQAQIAQQGQALQGMTSGAQMGLQGLQQSTDAYGQAYDMGMQGAMNYGQLYGQGLDYGMAGAMNAYNANIGGMTLGGQLAQNSYGMEMGGMGAAADIWRTQGQMDMAREQNVTAQYGIRSGVGMQQNANNMQLVGAGIGALGAIGGAAIGSFGGPAGTVAGGALGGMAGNAAGQAIQR